MFNVPHGTPNGHEVVFEGKCDKSPGWEPSGIYLVVQGGGICHDLTYRGMDYLFFLVSLFYALPRTSTSVSDSRTRLFTCDSQTCLLTCDSQTHLLTRDSSPRISV